MVFEILGSKRLAWRSKTRLVILAVVALVTLSLIPNWWSSPSTRFHTSCPANLLNGTLAKLGSLDPDPDDARQLAELWSHLTTIFHAHPPSPRRLIRPIRDRPSNRDIDAYTIENADDALYLTSEQADRTQKAHHQVLAKLERLDAASPPWHGRGIVILAGGRYSHIATTTISILRLYHHSQLPVEVWIGNDGNENQDWIEEMRRLGVCVRWLADYAELGSFGDWYNPFRWLDERPWSAYQWKVMALLFSSFEEVLFLDADSVPASDPEYLFESEEYKSSGAVIWPDLWQSISSSWLPYLVGLSDLPTNDMWHRQTAEAGQMMWNKRIHWKSLLLAAYYNYYGPSFWYTASIGSGPGWGDKDTYLLALEATGEDYTMVSVGMESIYARDSPVAVLNIQHQPRKGDARVPAFYHQAGGWKWSVEDFWTVKSRGINLWAYIKSTIFWQKASTLATLLEQDGRLLESREWGAADPEVLLWTGLQYVACLSRLGSEEACTWVRWKAQTSLGMEAVGTVSMQSC